MRTLFALLFLMQSWMFAQTRFDGTWRMKMDTLLFSGPPEEYLFADGMYHCKSCIPNQARVLEPPARRRALCSKSITCTSL